MKKKNKPAKKFQKHRLAAVPGARDVENPEAPQSFIFPLFFFHVQSSDGMRGPVRLPRRVGGVTEVMRIPGKAAACDDNEKKITPRRRWWWWWRWWLWGEYHRNTRASSGRCYCYYYYFFASSFTRSRT